MENTKNDQSECLLGFGEKLCLNENFADVIFIVEQERIPAHRNILAASSEYFRALLYGNFKESEKKEVELDANLGAFKFLLKYIYTGRCDFSNHKIEFVIILLKVANEYGYINLESMIADNLIIRLNYANLEIIMNSAHFYNLQKVCNHAMKYIEENTSLVIRSINFISFSKEVLFDIIGRDSFSVDELDIFKAIINWGKAQTAEDLKFVLSNVRYTLMQIGELRDVVAPTRVLKPEEIDQIIKDIKTVKSLPFRKGKIHRNQLDSCSNGNSTEYGFRFYGDCRMCKLPEEKLVNHVAVFFKDSKRCGYFLEVSRDKREWTRVIDYSKYPCFGEQSLYFNACMVRYLYIGIQCNDNISQYLKEVVVDINYYSFPPMIVNGVAALTYSHQSVHDFRKEIGEHTITYFFSQPRYINCMTTKCSIISKDMPILKTSTGLFSKTIKYQSDIYGKCFFFDGHIVQKVQISLGVLNISKVEFCFFFNPSKPLSFGIKV